MLKVKNNLLIKVKTPAKLNLFLEVGDKLNNTGFHEIYSLIEPISLFDTLEFYPSKDVKVEFISSSKIPSQDNTVIKSIYFLKNKYKISKGIRIRVIKEIPVGSGLGGGSSDAGCTLITLNKVWNLNLNNEQIKDIATSIGSDVPFFIFNTRCIVEGIGDRITPIFKKPIFWYLLIIPPFSVSTKKVYQYYDEFGIKGNLTSAKQNIKILLTAMKKGDVKKMEEFMFNRLKDVSEKIWKEIKEVRIFIEKKSRKKFFLTGSGGAFFSVFKEREEGERICSFFQYKNWKSIVMRSF